MTNHVRTSTDIEADRAEARAFYARMAAPRIVGRMRGYLERLAAMPSPELAACVEEARGYYNSIDDRNPVKSSNTLARAESEKVQKAQEAIEAQIDAELEVVAQAKRDAYRDQKRRPYVDAKALAEMPTHRVHESTPDEIAANRKAAQAHARRIGRRDPKILATVVREERLSYALSIVTQKTSWRVVTNTKEERKANGERIRARAAERRERLARRAAYKAALASGQLEIVGMTPERAFEISLAAYDKSTS